MGMIADLFIKLGLKKEGFDSGIDQAKKKTEGFTGVVKKLGGIMVAAFAVGTVTAFFKKSLIAYDEQAKAEQQLLVALKGRKDVQQDLINQANELQKTTLFTDDQIITAQATLAMFTKNGTAIKQLIPLVQDFATAYGMDLVSAAKLVGKTLGSSTNALARQGIEINGAVGSAERLSSVMKGLNERVGGQAAAAAQVGIGSVKLLSQAWGELFDTVGKYSTGAVDSIAKSLTKIVQESTKDVDDILFLWTNKNVSFLKKLGASLDAALWGTRGKAFIESQRAFEQSMDAYDQMEQQQQNIGKKVEATTESIKEQNKAIRETKNLTEMSGAVGTAFGTVKAPKSDITPLTTEGLFSTESGDMWTDAMSGTLMGLDTWYAGVQDKINEIKADLPDTIGTFNNELTNLIKFGSMDALVTLTDGLTNLAAGAITGKDFGNQVLKMVGNFMVQLGTLFIISSKAYQAFQTSLATGNFAGMLGAGIALVVAGAAISALAGKGVTGGSGAGSAGAAASGYNPSGSTAAQSLTGNVFFELEGVKLKGVLNNVDRRNNVMR